ncbi:hypothetical protein SLEP1_g35808 [Rubroshorea leprosula]|uniref:Ubiquitin-like domain-containing protein n=1 Tax=Rubroshorea leprosula TaxID=152421 RepID=A0AAV5KPP2_9ROSI|nr:hypothetical protein SLEP1_g35808 [Rubroshorea leprosula]
MKLRLRCLESKQTLRIQLPTPYTLHQLQQTLSLSLSPSPPSPSSLRFSLNARDELSPSSSDASLESLGVTAGDLVYFSLNPNAFSPNPEALVQGSPVALWQDYPRPERSFNAVFRRNPNPFGVFPMIGGDYDLLPVPVVNYPFARSGLAFTRSRPRQTFRPYCNLGRTHGAEHLS